MFIREKNTIYFNYMSKQNFNLSHVVSYHEFISRDQMDPKFGSALLRINPVAFNILID